MKNNHQQYIEMCKNVIRFYRKNEDYLDLIPDVKNYFLQLSALKDKLGQEFDLSISYYNGYSISRARKRDELQKQCLLMGADLTKLKDSIKYKPIHELKSFICLKYEDMDKLNETEMMDYASKIYDLLELAKPRLKIQGTKEKDMDAFTQVLTLNALDLPMNRQSIEERKSATLNSLKTYSDLIEIFNENLDPIFESIKDKESELVHQYNLARQVPIFDTNTPCDFDGTLKNDEVHLIGEFKYDFNREFRMSVEGGNAIWGLSNSADSIEHSRPITPREKILIKSRIIGDDGNLLLIQAVNKDAEIRYKVWIEDWL
jgi:hypothetical protein